MLDAVFDPGEVLPLKSVKAATIACDLLHGICCVVSQLNYFGALCQIQGYTLHLAFSLPLLLLGSLRNSFGMDD
jgi:hypothetical protein